MPVSRESSRVAAVGCFFPPTDFANYGKEGEIVIGRGKLPVFMAPFDFKDFDGATGMYVPVTDEAKKRGTLRSISPGLLRVEGLGPGPDFPRRRRHAGPAPAVRTDHRAVQAGRACRASWWSRKGAGHGWKGVEEDVDRIADWFDKYLGK